MDTMRQHITRTKTYAFGSDALVARPFAGRYVSERLINEK